VRQRFLVVLGIFFLFLFIGKVRALPTIVCDKDVYYALQKFDAYCNITNDLTQNITVWNYTLLFPIDDVTFKPYIKENVTYNITVPEFEPCLRNLTINGTWEYNASDGYYYGYDGNTTYVMNCTSIYSINQTNDTCEYNSTCLVGSHEEERWKWSFVDLTLPFEMLASETKEFKFHVEVPIGTSGKFNVTATVFYDSENVTVSLDPWWNSSWQYRRPITITEQSGNTLTDYQVAINLTYDSDMQSDFSDIRFTYYNSTNDTETEIPYWIEEKVDSSWAYVWVKVLEIQANDNATIYIYYGNPSATSESNGFQVFDIFDDFEGDVSSRWTALSGSVRTVSDLDGQALQLLGSSTDTLISNTNITSSWQYYRVQHQLKFASFGIYGPRFFGIIRNDTASKLGVEIEIGGGSEKNILFGYGFSSASNTVGWSTGTVYNFIYYVLPDKLYWSRDGGTTTFLSQTGTSQDVTNERYMYLKTWDRYNDVRIDNLIVRKYTDPEPTYEIGAEETYGIPGCDILVTDCQTLNQSNKVYCLTQDIVDRIGTCFNITANNVTFDCQGHTIDGTGGDYGIYLWRNTSNITIRNCYFSDWGKAIQFDFFVKYVNIYNNTFYNNFYVFWTKYNHTSIYFENNTINASSDFAQNAKGFLFPLEDVSYNYNNWYLSPEGYQNVTRYTFTSNYSMIAHEFITYRLPGNINYYASGLNILVPKGQSIPTKLSLRNVSNFSQIFAECEVNRYPDPRRLYDDDGNQYNYFGCFFSQPIEMTEDKYLFVAEVDIKAGSYWGVYNDSNSQTDNYAYNGTWFSIGLDNDLVFAVRNSRSENIVVRNNVFYNITHDDVITVRLWKNVLIENNTIYSNDSAGVYIRVSCGSEDVIVRNNRLTGACYLGFWFNGNTFEQNNFSIYNNSIEANCLVNLGIEKTTNFYLYNNNITTSQYSIYIYDFSRNGEIYDNNIVGTGYLDFVSNLTFTNNNITGGIYLENTINSTVKGNRINSDTTGIYISVWTDAPYYYEEEFYTRNNHIYNNLINASEPVSFLGTPYPNYWNTTYQAGTNIWNASLGYIGGNLWTNPSNTGYSDNCTDANSDGFCDSAYTLATNNTDYLPIAKQVGQGAPYLTITFNYNQVNFGTLNHNTLNSAPNQSNGIYNVSVDTDADYEVYARGYDFTGPASLSISNLYFDTNETASNLSYSDAISLSTSNQLIDTNISYTYTTNYHGYWLNIPYKQRAGTYNTTVIITYANV